MKINTDLTAHDWDKALGHEELLARLTALKLRVGQSLPILDDDDLEDAIEEAADRLSSGK
ncbi:MAG: hypothetical protein M0026_10235 [Nocardiopsaceae bacterium]|nr:hypothetical protein [Nocardiopsaceae bacterium]